MLFEEKPILEVLDTVLDLFTHESLHFGFMAVDAILQKFSVPGKHREGIL